MSGEGKRKFVGPIEEHDWPEKLEAHVVTPGPRPRIHGYDVEGDLARHYSFAETMLLALTGELPDEKTGRAFEIAMQFLAPTSVAEAPTHAATVARICGGVASGVHGVGALALAEQARYCLAEHADLLRWLVAPSGELPPRYRDRGADAGGGADRLSESLVAIGYRVPALDQRPTPTAAIISTLFSCGLTASWQLEAVYLTAKTTAMSAEAHAARAGDFSKYPMDYPHFSYEEE